LRVQGKKPVYKRTLQLGKFCLINASLGGMSVLGISAQLDACDGIGDYCDKFRRSAPCVGMISAGVTTLRTVAVMVVALAEAEWVFRWAVAASGLELSSYLD
jgi:hypothetical protein